MAHFVSCDGGWVNLDHVARVREQRRADGIRRFEFEGPDGRIIGRQSYASDNLDELTAPIVPAAADSAALVISAYCDGDCGRPDSVYTRRVPIVAWRLLYGGALPVLLEAVEGTDTVLIEQSDGRLVEPDESSFDTVEAAESGVLLSAQESWDRHRAKQDRAVGAAP